MPMVWSCGVEMNTLQLQTIDCSRYLSSWKVGQNSGLSESTQGRPSSPSSAFQQRNRRPTCIYMVSLLAENNPTYLGVTLDKRLTWKQQTEKAEAKAKAQHALMKLAGVTWDLDTVSLKRLYTGRVRPVLEYGMTAWGTTAKSNFDRVSKVQNQATRIITGAMKSTPTVELETITWLQSPDDCRHFKLLNQAAKFKRLQHHPMKQRLSWSQPTKWRLRRESFIHQSRILEQRQEETLDYDP